MTLKKPMNCVILDKRIGTEWPLPEYKTEHAAGLDLRACIDEPLTLEPGQCELVSSGLSIHIANPELVGKLFPRSGSGHKHGLVLGNLTGIIDADYTGPLMVSLWNRSNVPYTIEPGERIAQLVITPVIQADLNFVASHEETARGEGGFGSTGKQ